VAKVRAITRCLPLLVLSWTLTSALPGRVVAQTIADSDRPDITPETDAEPRVTSVIDPTLRVLQRASRRKTAPGGLFAPGGSFDAKRVQVSLRFDASIDAQVRARLDRLDVRLEAGALSRDGLYRASVPWGVLDRVARLPGLIRIEALWQARIDSPLEQTNQLIHATAARLRPPDTPRGAGVRIGLIDTGIDVLHPALFRADAGYFAWIDVDEDASFTPGTDAVDLDADGEVDRNEVLNVLDATVIVDFADGEVSNADGVFDTRRDWVYADMNRDGTRNAGPDAGFSESSPAWGEAVFVADDADRSGTLDVGEKLVRLGTSKIARYRTRETTFVRGENLIEAATQSVDAFHGTGVGGILVGGQPPFHDRAGVAPGADLYVYGLSATLQRDNSLPLQFLEDAVDDGVSVLLHEWTNSFTQPMDGSTNFEAAMSSSRETGVAHVNPVGNLNLSQKHRIAQTAAGEPTTFTVVVGDGFDAPSGTLDYTAAFGSMQWRASHPGLELEVTAPGGQSHRWVVDGVQTAELAGATVDLAYGETPRGSGYIEFYLETTDVAQPLAAGEWTLTLTGFASEDEVWARVTDDYSNWRPGIHWKSPTTGRGTIAFPSTADAAFGVGAYTGRGAFGESAAAGDHELRAFSGRSPRLDGEIVVQVTAPDDPYVPLAATPEILDAGWGRSWYTAFGGTSGAAPHVAGTMALMRGLGAELSPEQTERLLVDTATSDDLSPVPAQVPGEGWGYGRLNAYAALFGEPAPELGEPPEAVLDVRESGDVLALDAAASLPSDQLQYRFDVDYDGVWDTEWLDTPETTVDVPQTSRQVVWIRLDVRNARGQLDGAIASWTPGVNGGDTGDAADADTPDVGADTGSSPPKRGCCSQAHESAPTRLSWWLAVGVLVLLRCRGRFWRR
jgi:subtilisin family serine protease